MKVFLSLLFTAFFLVSCGGKKAEETTPWGTTMDADADSVSESSSFSLDDIVRNGELIMLTMSGPETYYDYHGKGMGADYMLCEKFAQRIGVSLRVEVCKDTTEMLSRLAKGDGDIIAFPLPRQLSRNKHLSACGVRDDKAQTSWAVDGGNQELADSLNHWFKLGMVAEVRKEESFLLSTRSIRRHVYAPMLDSGKGIISKYDRYFKMYGQMARMDWRLMAAQCYQESCFDPDAKSWAGACGLMQIMPSTADHLGLPQSAIHDPEQNIAAAAKYLQELSGKFGDIPDPSQRIFYVLASYNGGFHHVRDAMALARKYNRNPYSWGDVSEFILKLRQPAYYRDPVVKYGYMRGEETSDYVSRIRQRWAQYRGVAGGGSIAPGKGFSDFGSGMTPSRAKHKYRFDV